MTEPPAKRLDPRAQRSRTALRGALVELLGEIPVEQISILALTARASVGYATFFRNYADIDAVLSDLSGVLIEELAELAHPVASGEGDDAAAKAIAHFAVERQTVLKPLFVGASATLQRDIIQRATEVAKTRPPRTPVALPADLALAHPIVVICTIFGWWLGQTDKASEDELATIISRLAFAPVNSFS